MWWYWIVFAWIGFVIGVIAGSITGDSRRVFLIDIFLGIVGALAGGWLFALLIKRHIALAAIAGSIAITIILMLALKQIAHMRRRDK